MARKKSAHAQATQAKSLHTLIHKLAQKDEAVVLLRTAASAHNRLLFVNVALAVATELRLQGLPKCDDLFSAVVRLATHHPHQCLPVLCTAIGAYRDERRRNRKLHRYLVDRLGLNRSRRQAWLQNLPQHSLDRLAHSYPPLGHFVSESPEIAAKWEQRLL